MQRSKDSKIQMKNVFINLLICLFAYLLITIPSSAATPTPTKATGTPVPSRNEVPEDSADLEKIQRIKELVASKVAELNLVEKRGIIGTVREVSNMKVVITDLKGNSRQVDVDELTKFNISKTSSGISDLQKGTMYSFIGLYNKDTHNLLARSVSSTATIPVYFEGALVSVDADSYQIAVVNEKGETKKIDIESSTKTSISDDEGDLVKSGFSKLTINERVLAIGFLGKKDTNTLSALRIIHFKNAPPSKEMQSHVKTESETKEAN